MKKHAYIYPVKQPLSDTKTHFEET